MAGEPACDETPFGSYGSSTIMLKNISGDKSLKPLSSEAKELFRREYRKLPGSNANSRRRAPEFS